MNDGIRFPALQTIAPIRAPALDPASPAGTPVEGPGSFGEVLTGAITEARGNEKAAVDAAERFASGDASTGIHEVMIAQEKAAIAVRYAVTLKNRALEAYRELMNTPV